MVLPPAGEDKETAGIGRIRPIPISTVPEVDFWWEAALGFRFIEEFPAPMARTQQTFRNGRDGPVYVSVEPWPECFELEPGDKLTLVWDASTTGDTMQIDFINERELVV